uniref:Uncharacterized protein n=1 Tax=Coccolithus braarudii TaxID=221442 RepID=A0A7S0LG25_9EUKA|mmetsp:Transcript_36761/g.78447  ORF Transcript_36761/g.78447 Transcript_36761/m.78447 type:complete len:110 (+) Transcript_36761:301-630(+)
MMAWKKDQGLAASDHIDFVADSHAQLTDALGLVMTGADNPFDFAKAPGPVYDGPNKALGFHTKRCKRSAILVESGVVKLVLIAEANDDPAGDSRPEVSCIENVLSEMKA